ncbi:sugar ABC transporter substrate-binding protein [Halanaerobaculum tunisiense]
MKQILGMLLIISLLTTACQLNIKQLNPLTPQPPSKKEISIGVSIGQQEKKVAKLMKKAFRKNKRKENTTITWKNAKNNLEQQNKDVLNLINQEVDVIIIRSLNTSQQGREMIDLIKKNNIPVVALDKLPRNCNVDAYISADNFKTGQLQARYLIDQLNKEGKIIILQGPTEDKIVQDIITGNKEEIKKYDEVTIQQEKNWSQKTAKRTIKDYIKTKAQSKIKGILATNDQLALGAITALKQKGLNQDITVVGATASKAATKAVAKEDLAATIDKMPYIRALHALNVATFIAREENWNWDNKIKNGSHEVNLVTTPVRLINKYNVYSLQDRWPDINLKK